MKSTLAMCARIVFGATSDRPALELRKPSAVTIETSVQQLCQSATLTLPRNIRQFTSQPLNTLIRRGDPIQVHLGYDGDLQLEFEGYVETVGADVPVVITLKDRLWKTLQRAVNKSYKDAHLPTVVKDLIGADFAVEAMPATIGPLRFEKTTVAKALKALKDDYGFVTYLKGGTVYCGVLYTANASVVKYRMETNVKSSSLQYRLADDVKLKVEAKSLQRNGKTITVTVGDEDGEHRTLNYYGISSKEQLKKLAESDMQKFKYNGYTGSFQAFGIPYCRFGDKVDLSSSLYPERDGQYLAEAVKVEFTSDPHYQRDVTLAQRWI